MAFPAPYQGDQMESAELEGEFVGFRLFFIHKR